jgi:hypothetical protein
MRLARLLLLAFLLAGMGIGIIACKASSARSTRGALDQACQFGRQRIEALVHRQPAPIVLSRDPLPFEGMLSPDLETPENIVPEDLKLAWSRQPRKNLLEACPALSSIPGVRLARPGDDVTTYGSSTTIYYFSAPVFDRARDDVLIMEGFYCAGRCGGYAIEHHRRNGKTWDRQVPLTWVFG